MAKEELDQPIEREADLLAIIDEEIASGITFETDLDSDSRSRALEYLRGHMADLPADQDWSHAVSRDVSDTVDDIMPGLMRVFAGAGQIVTYGPNKRGDEQTSAQATDYINYLWANDLNGYFVLVTAIFDALTVRNGIIKVYWDPSPDYETEDLRNLDDMQLTLLLQDPEVSLIGHQESQQVLSDPATGQPVPITLHDIRIRRATNNGRLKLECVAPENFGLNCGAKTPDDARIDWEYLPKTRSDLIKEGYPRDIVDDLPAWSNLNEEERLNRENRSLLSNAPAPNRAMEQVDVYECYMMYDHDGDGIADRCKIVVCGPNGARKLLSIDPCPDDVPYVDLKPQIVPHRWEGRSIADMTMDLQRIKTAVLRGGLDNIYLANRPQREVVENDIINPDEVMNPKIAGVIRVKKAGAITNLPTEFIGDKTLMWLNYVDTIKKQRTGSDQGGAALDATALDPQTATAEQIEHDKSYSRIELIARNIAELGLKKLFAKILRITVRNQDRPRTIRLRDEWHDMDPRAWNANMDATINVGLGTGSRERDLAMLGGIQKQQTQIVQELGPDNPVVPPSKYVNTLHKMVEAAGLRNPDQFFTPITDDEYRQWQQSQPPKQDPKMIEAQARTQIAGQKAQSDAQRDGQKGQAQLSLQGQKAAGDIAIKREKMLADVELAREKAHLDYAEGLQELEMEERLKELEIKQRGEGPGETELRRPN